MRKLALIVLVALALAGCRKKSASQDWPAGMSVVTPEEGAARVRAAKGDVVLFVLYASWCSGCRAELPGVDRVVDEFGQRGLRVVGLALDEDPKDYAEMLEDEKPRFDLVRVAPIDNAALESSVRSLGGHYAGSIPYTALFAKDGSLVKEWTDGAKEADLRARIAPLL